jgi:hypothetical protein
MVVGPVFLVVVLLPLIALGGGALLAAGLLRRPAPAPSEAATAARRHAATVSLLAWVAAALTPPVALLAFVMTLRWSAGSGRVAGVLMALTPAGVGLVFLAVHALGERTWPRPTGTIRRAALTPRSTADVAPRWLRRLVWGWAGLLGATLVVCVLTTGDDQFFIRTWDGGAALGDPFPGWYYGVPLMVAAALVPAASEVVLRLIACRPAVMDAQPEWDLGLRRLSAHRVLRGVQLVLGLTSTGALVFAGDALDLAGRSNVDIAAGGLPTSNPALAALGVAFSLGAFLVGLASLVITLVPGRPAVAPVLP